LGTFLLVRLYCFLTLFQAQWLIESGTVAQSRLTIEDPSEGRFEEATLVTSNRDSIAASESWIPCTTDMLSLSGSTETTLLAAPEDSPGLRDFELVNDLDPALEKDQGSVRPLFLEFEEILTLVEAFAVRRHPGKARK
jgi:hypothetical protein